MILKQYHYTRILPTSISTEYVECFRVYRFQGAAPVSLQPEGKFEWIFQLNGCFSQVPHSAEEWALRPQSFIGGLHLESYAVRPHQEKSMVIGITFSPKGARYFIPADLHQFKNKLIPIQEVFKYQQLHWTQQFQEEESIPKKIQLLEAFLQQIFKVQGQSPIDQAIDLIIHKKGLIKVRELARQVYLSPAQFRKRFNAEVGMSPKEYCKIIRIQHILQHLERQPKASLTRLAHEWHYFDQAHFIKDFQAFMGTTPREWVREG